MNKARKVSSKYKIASLVVIALTVLSVQSKNKLFLSNAFHNSLTASVTDTAKPRLKFPLPKTSPILNSDTFPQRKKNTQNDS